MKVLPPGGLHVDDQDLHWIRKLKVGDVVKVEQPPAADAAAKRAKS